MAEGFHVPSATPPHRYGFFYIDMANNISMTLELSAIVRDLRSGDEYEVDFPITVEEIRELITPGADYIFVTFDSNFDVSFDDIFGDYVHADTVNEMFEAVNNGYYSDDDVVDILTAYKGILSVDEFIEGLNDGSFTLYHYENHWKPEEDIGIYAVEEVYEGITNLPEYYLENFFDYEEFGSAFIDENRLYKGENAYVGYY